MTDKSIIPLVCSRDGKVYLVTDGTWCPVCGIDNTHKHAKLSGTIIEFEGSGSSKEAED